MASGGGDKQQFPPQKQEAQPGKEHQMDPKPECFSQDFTPSNKLRGKVSLVTGGDSGIGRAVCHYFAAEGATVAFTYVKEQEDKDAKETLEILKKAKTSDAKEPMATAADLGYEQNCKRVVDEVIKAYEKLDILVNNAVEQHESPLEDIEERQRTYKTHMSKQLKMQTEQDVETPMESLTQTKRLRNNLTCETPPFNRL